MNREETFYNSWDYLNNLEEVYYKGINYFYECLRVEVVKVNPNTMEIDLDNSKNTKVQVWLEFGGVFYNETFNCFQSYHDINLDCGADTFEQAIIELAKLCKQNGYKERNKK